MRGWSEQTLTEDLHVTLEHRYRRVASSMDVELSPDCPDSDVAHVHFERPARIVRNLEKCLPADEVHIPAMVGELDPRL